jgi:hypothetical protein
VTGLLCYYTTIEGYDADGNSFCYNAQKAAVGSTAALVGAIAGAKDGAAGNLVESKEKTKIIVRLFDYVFYRVYKVYAGRKNVLADSFASSLLSLIQFLTLFDVMFAVKMFWDFNIPDKGYFIPVIVLIVALNWYRYERDFDAEKYENRRKDEEPIKRKRNGWLIALYLIWSFLFPVTYEY